MQGELDVPLAIYTNRLIQVHILKRERFLFPIL
jgi:hypothetical protein